VSASPAVCHRGLPRHVPPLVETRMVISGTLPILRRSVPPFPPRAIGRMRGRPCHPAGVI
jgi:hypothetical protein